MSDLTEALHEARNLYVREEYATSVKNVFLKHFEQLEPGATVEDTLYFNHSAIPDFKISWGRGSRSKATRDIFLRSSYASVVAGDEPNRITSGDPIFLSISPDQSVEEPGFTMTNKDVAGAVEKSSHALLTDAQAFEDVTAPVEDANPLSTIIRSNFLRGARGLVDEPAAERLRSVTQSVNGSVTDLIRESFFEDAVFRMERTASLVQWALSANPASEALPNLSGSMTTDELRSVLPWILRQSLPREPDFWASLGSLFTFEQLEELGPEINGVDIGPLVRANLSTWTAKRAYLGFNATSDGPIDPEDDGILEVTTESSQSLEHSGWQFNAGTLGLSRNASVVRVSNSGNKLKARPGSLIPRWSDTADRLNKYSIRSISLAGVERAFRVEAKESSSIKSDVDRMVHSVEDTYFVERIEVLLPGQLNEESGDVSQEPVEMDFAGAITISSRPVQIGALIRATSDIIGRENVDDALMLPE